MSKAFDKDGNEIEIFTAEEHQASVTAEVEKVKGEYTPKLAAVEDELKLAKTALGDRAGEFKQFQKLHADVVGKLSVSERALYDNQLAMENDRKQREADAKTARENARDTAIRAKSGADDKLFGKMKDMYELIGVQANTTEEIENKVKMVLGAIGSTEPDAIASVAGFTGGSFKPPEIRQETKSYADTEEGKRGAAELGLKIPEAKKE